MGTAILHNRVLRIGGSGGMPEYTFDGTHTVIDDGSTSGTWQIALTSSGTLTIGKDAKKVTIQAQGGGGSGGASNGSTKGSDGYDGDIASYEGDLAAGSYSVTIGAGGAQPTNAKGSSGGTTTMGDLISASGGAGGAYAGGATQTHSGLYSTYGHGGEGGTTSQVTVTNTYYVSGAGATLYSSPSDDAATSETLTSGKHKTISAQSSRFYYISSGTHAGKYVKKSDVTWTSEITNQRYKGNAGNPGVVVLSGEA